MVGVVLKTSLRCLSDSTKACHRSKKTTVCALAEWPTRPEELIPVPVA